MTWDLCNVVEDEHHVLIECPHYVNIRKESLPSELVLRPSMFAFINYLKCENNLEYMKLGKLCAMVQKVHTNYSRIPLIRPSAS